MPSARSQTRSRPADGWGFEREGRDLLVAITGGAIVGMPLLYTMEMWSSGLRLGPAQQLALLVGTLLINWLFSTVSGFRHEYGVLSAALESVTAVGIGLVFSGLILWLVGEISLADPAPEIFGKVLFQTVPVSLGVSVADAHVRGKRRDGEDDDEAQSQGKAPRQSERPARSELERRQLRQDVRDVSATLSGALLFSINIGPTEEVILIAGRLAAPQLAAVVLASLLLCYIILFASGVKDHPVHIPNLVQSPLAETVITYAASLLVALGLLVVLGEPEAIGSVDSLVAATVALGLPTAVGGAAGRLAL
jgi:putative integral membrane protein (TIGR02587 family)